MIELTAVSVTHSVGPLLDLISRHGYSFQKALASIYSFMDGTAIQKSNPVLDIKSRTSSLTRSKVGKAARICLTPGLPPRHVCQGHIQRHQAALGSFCRCRQPLWEISMIEYLVQQDMHGTDVAAETSMATGSWRWDSRSFRRKGQTCQKGVLRDVREQGISKSMTKEGSHGPLVTMLVSVDTLECLKDHVWVWPPASNSHHQDYYIFSRESLSTFMCLYWVGG